MNKKTVNIEVVDNNTPHLGLVGTQFEVCHSQGPNLIYVMDVLRNKNVELIVMAEPKEVYVGGIKESEYRFPVVIYTDDPTSYVTKEQLIDTFEINK